ncbi:succinylglutamate desuccinylase/aspartoacylase domain-containing protein [Laspinema olomoucense]|uniref:succinylglutamate desuccinylase/aspartoacylase domain-containing protein n=1 Tax=Laspinema olomoucense TaxID=3231600 RepID=UPI0021BB4DB8|nr:succinylglutamate desuccinylase/aspartoacylase family protein [Laspinema sp. D3c]MCT7993650.1 succinylglutamate desuccinylase/aspartoacylase family protein [Laspinema sp. D3c]
MLPIIETIPIVQLASGDRLFIQVYKFIGDNPGPKAYIQSNLHGAEIAGNAVIHQFIEFLQGVDDCSIKGEIWLVPVCNPLGINQRSQHFSSGRYHSYDGKDWNRIFWDYEKEATDIHDFAYSLLNVDPEEIEEYYRQIILTKFHQLLQDINATSGVPFVEQYRYQLQSLSLDANYVIDCHSSTNQGLDYLYCFNSREESAKAFLLDYAILMNEYDGDAFDEAGMKPWLALEKSFAKQGKPIQFDVESWTLELGTGMQMNPQSVAKGLLGIQNYLATKGMLNIPGFPLPETNFHSVIFITKDRIRKYYATAGGMIQNRLPLGTVVKTGDCLYQLLSFDKTGEPPKIIDITAVESGLIADISMNYSANQGDYILSIFQG